MLSRALVDSLLSNNRAYREFCDILSLRKNVMANPRRIF